MGAERYMLDGSGVAVLVGMDVAVGAIVWVGSLVVVMLAGIVGVGCPVQAARNAKNISKTPAVRIDFWCFNLK